MSNNCPIGMECPESNCPNRKTCENQTLSWDIPYEKTDEGLRVKEFGWRREWKEENTHFGSRMEQPNCQIPSGTYFAANNDYNESENKQRIREEWEKEGWKAAEPNPNFSNEEEDTLMPF